MRRTFFVVTAVAVLSTTVFGVVDAGVAGAAGPAASGTIGCKVTGSGTFSPKLTLSGSSTAVKINFKAKGGCSGTVTAPNSAGALGPVTVASVSISGTGYFKKSGAGFANKCSAVQSSDKIGVITVTYNWTSSPSIAPTVVTFTGGTPSLFTPIIATSMFDKIKLPDPSGTVAATTGSFAPAVAPVVVLDTNVKKTCGAGWSYLAFNVVPGSYVNLP